MRLKSVIACLMFAPMLVAAVHPVELEPTTPWDVDYGDNSCRLIRTFGSGKTETKLAFESDTPGALDMLVIGKSLRTSEERVAARFLPVRGATFDGDVAQTVDKGDPAILWGSVRMAPDDLIAKQKDEQTRHMLHPEVRPPATNLSDEASDKAAVLQFADATTGLEIESRHDRPVILKTGPLGDALRTFDQCIRESQKEWGVDPALEDKIVRPVWALNPTQWLSTDDYPRDLIMRGKESEVSVRLLIDATGKVTRCTPLSHYAETEFAQISCAKITQRARFAPAELADGTKVPSSYVRRIKFKLAR